MKFEVSFEKSGVYQVNMVEAETADIATAYFHHVNPAATVNDCTEFHGIVKPGMPCITVPEGWQPVTVTANDSATVKANSKPGTARTLKHLIPLKSKITVYVPATVNVSEEVDNSAQVERVARLLSSAFGGATASPVRGYWVANDGALVAERTTMVFAYCDTDAAERYIDDVVGLCVELKHEMQQEAIALEYNGAMYFI